MRCQNGQCLVLEFYMSSLGMLSTPSTETNWNPPSHDNFLREE